MIQDPHIYAVIIGSEILDRRRTDKHFDYLSKRLQSKGFKLFASLTLKDDSELITQTYKLVANDPQAMMFSFGGIGSTPDDLTRQLSADVFRDGKLYRHPKFEQDILDRLGERAYPHPIKMSDLPKDAELIFNPINNMSGFYLDKRYFFMPGFPEMAQPMMDHIIDNFLPTAPKSHVRSFVAHCGEGRLTELMMQVPNSIELSSLPMMNGGNPMVEFSLSGPDAIELENAFRCFTDFLHENQITFTRL